MLLGNVVVKVGFSEVGFQFNVISFLFYFAFTISEFANVAKKNFRKFVSYTQIRKSENFFHKSQNREILQKKNDYSSQADRKGKNQ
jgi:hypothetical protein